MAVEGGIRSGGRAWPGRPPRGQSQRPRDEPPRLRVLWLLAVALLLATAIWGRLAYWQVAEHGYLSAVAAELHQTTIPLPATRGMIYDAAGRPLALDDTVYDVTLAPDLVPPDERQHVADELAAILGVQTADVLKELNSGRKFAYVAKRQSKDRADQLRRLQLPGVYLQALQQRSYLPGGAPDTSLAAGLLGFVNFDGVGQRGIEQRYQQRLAGRAGYDSTYRDLQGRQIVLGPEKRLAPVNGADLQLTLDANIQYAAEQAISAGVAASKAESGAVIVMDSKTGGIVAYAETPTYDANKFNTTDPARTRDMIASDLYEPGSVMKVVTLAGAIDAGAITPNTVINDPGYINVAGSVIHDWDLRSHGNITMTRVLEESYNVGAVKAMQAEGHDSFFHYLDAFGFNRPSGLDVSGEAFVPLRPEAQWRDAEVATASFGQGIAVNMVQMCAALNVIPNGGRWVQPHVVQDVGGQPVAAPPERQAVSAQTAEEMNRMMRSVVQHGSGYKARIPGFELDEAGKTGTSQIPVDGKYGGPGGDQVWASYAGFLPALNPRFTMLVMVKRPNNGSFDHNEGYYVSAPIWKQIAQQIILQWHLTPEAVPPV